MTQMTARYAGRCANTGASIRPGDTIEYDRESRRTVLVSALRRQASRYSRTDVAVAKQSATAGLALAGNAYAIRVGVSVDAGDAAGGQSQ